MAYNLIFQDDFNRANSLVVGNGWIAGNQSSWQISNNVLYTEQTPSSGDSTLLRPITENFLTGQFSFDVRREGAIAYPSLIFKYQPNGSHYRIQPVSDGNNYNVFIAKTVNGVNTNLVSKIVISPVSRMLRVKTTVTEVNGNVVIDCKFSDASDTNGIEFEAIGSPIGHSRSGSRAPSASVMAL